jgi:peptidoglycan/xylan/chitin deacetylase (PgdA/CDA1 family)
MTLPQSAPPPAGILPPAPAPARWQPTLLLRASAAVHGSAAAITALQPHWWPWTAGAVVANHLQLAATGLWPRSSALGPNWTRLPSAAARRGEVALTIDDGPDPQVTPAVLAMLAAHRVRATFFCIGERAERHPELVRACVAHGHAIENHSYHHRHHFSLLGPRALRIEVARGQQALARLSGRMPTFFRAPAGLRSPLLDPVLHRLGLQLASWTRRGFDTVRGDPVPVLRRLCRNLRAGDILLLHDGHAAHTSSGAPVVLEVLPPLLAAIAQAGLRPVTLAEARGQAAFA